MYKNDYQGGKSFKIGDKGEKTFMSHASEMGWKPRKSSHHEDMHNHIDFWVEMYGVQMAVDVKGIKEGIDEGMVTVELLNVLGNHGWLYGQAHIIAFQITNDEWIMVQREDLVKLVHRKMNVDSPFELNERKLSRNKFCSAPNWYRRFGRQDAITNLPIEKVKGL